MNKAPLLIKLSGECFDLSSPREERSLFIRQLIDQIAQLSQTRQIGLVVGGGNFFRGSQHGKALGMRPAHAHHVGMVATQMNGLILQDLLEQRSISTTLVSALNCPAIAQPINQQLIDLAQTQGKCIIFAGGTGTPYFSTDTTAVVRALQMGAREIWKGTKVDGIYNTDPLVDSSARPIKSLSYQEILDNKLSVIDSTAALMAQEQQLKLRVFNVFTPNALLLAANDSTFGSTVQ